jgi:phosphatidylglycerol:prolipoprotein diacylglycerol transferase
MFPHFTVGPYIIYNYALLYSFMYLVIGMYGFNRLLRLPFPPQVLGRGMLLVILGLFLGSLIPTFGTTFWDWFITGTFFWHGPVRVIGGMVVAIPAAYFYLRRHGIPIGRAFDLGSLPIPLGLAIGRLGCLAAGCCGGAPSDSLLAMVLPDLNRVWAARYPTQLLSFGANLAIFFILVGWERYGTKKVGAKKSYPFDGFLFLLFLELYFIKRFIVQFLRNDNLPLIGPLSATHLFFLAGIGVVSVVLLVRLLRNKGDNLAKSPKLSS